MKVVLASESKKKIAAVTHAFNNLSSFELVTLNAPSNVNEQPVGEETLVGAKNRIAFAIAAHPDAEIYVSIENGLFEENGAFVDKAVVVLKTAEGNEIAAMSDGVVFPSEYVEKTRERRGGFAKWTVGKTMAEHGVVQDDGDPHLELSGRPRQTYLEEAISKALSQLKPASS